jgi:hypothetical protein
MYTDISENYISSIFRVERQYVTGETSVNVYQTTKLTFLKVSDLSNAPFGLGRRK